MGKTCWGCFPFKFGLCFILVWHMVCACYQLALWKNIWNEEPSVMCVTLPDIQALLEFLRYAAAISWFTEPALGIIMGSGFLAWTATGPLQPCPMPYVAFTMYLWLGGLYSLALLAETVTIFYMLLALTSLPYTYILILSAYYCIASVFQLEWLRQTRRAQIAVNPKLLARSRHRPQRKPTVPSLPRPPPPRWSPRLAPADTVTSHSPRAPNSEGRPTILSTTGGRVGERVVALTLDPDYALIPPPTPRSQTSNTPALLPQTPPPSYQSAVSGSGGVGRDGQPQPPPAYETWAVLNHGEGLLRPDERRATRALWLDTYSALAPTHLRL